MSHVTALITSIVAGLLNFILSLIIPCLMKDLHIDFFTRIKKVFSNNKELLLTSSLIVVLLVYLSLSITPQIEHNLRNLSKLIK